MTVDQKWDRLDAELLDVLQNERLRDGRPMNFRTAETKNAYPLPSSRATPLLYCPYCGTKRRTEHSDLPALDPYFDA